MKEAIHEESIQLFCKAVLSLKTEKEMRSFLEDLCTMPELKAFAQRLMVAKMLNEKRVYAEIVDRTGASTATISRVNRSLVYGNDTFHMLFERLFGEEAIAEARRKVG
ncbi:MAG: hypothetical protein LBR73_06415 [Oscillospiraceae bacterium]|jgi:TrpR-related protein YerC/YecD|nr:hypothetical protein [Oscillospiraceae bacterium]